MSGVKVSLSSYKNAKSMEEKNLGIKTLQMLLSRGKAIKSISTLDELRIVHGIVELADAFWFWNSRGLLKDEIELYKQISKKYAQMIKDFYFIKKKPISVVDGLKKVVGETDLSHKNRLYEFEEKLKLGFDALARLGDFDSFIIAMEWYRPASSQFYLPRRDTLIRHNLIRDLQDLFDGKIRTLLIEAPPGIGKSVLGSMWCSFRNLYYKNGRGLIGNANSALTKGFFNDMFRFLSDSEYRAAEIFGAHPILSDAEYTSLYWGRAKKREPNVMCRSVESGATGIIHLNKEGYLYLDDTIKNSEEANSRDRLQKVIYSITSTFMDRADNEQAPLLHIGTPWSLYDFSSYLKGIYSGNDWFRVNSIPAYYLDEDTGKEITNFDYQGEHYKSVAFWKKQIEVDDPIIANAKFLMKPMERDGQLFDSVSTFTIEEFEEIRKAEKPYIVSAVDVAVAKGGDYFAQGFFYVFEKRREVYLLDVIYSNKGTDYTLPLSARKLIYHNVERVEFEEKEGALNRDVNYGVANTVRTFVKNLGGKTINFSNHSGAGLKSKSNRIDMYQAEIRGNNVGDRYILKFLCEKDRRKNPEYIIAMNHLSTYSSSKNAIGKQFDDFPDMLAMNFAYNLENAKKVKFFNIKI